MAIKKCLITTERFIVEVICFHPEDQTVYVKLDDGTYIIYFLKIVHGKAFYHESSSSELEESTLKYKCQMFYDYIKNIVEDALKWIEYWRELEDDEVITLDNAEPESIN